MIVTNLPRPNGLFLLMTLGASLSGSDSCTNWLNPVLEEPDGPVHKDFGPLGVCLLYLIIVFLSNYIVLGVD